MAKILVADDNSNVQKTVSLALTDLGVDVISVNNGDAAIKRLSDVSPDLVLADIFMPVRNGYEVCEFVKKNSRFTHVPVVLLVGAFDPLDEREAQRVGADGILKKPFVPPEPLINMVKTLLDRSLGERLVTVSSTRPVPSAAATASAASVSEMHPTEPEPVEELAQEEFTPPAAIKVSFGEGDAPVAFGQLLDVPAKTAVPEPTVGSAEDTDQVVTSARDSALGDPIFWKSEEPEAEGEQEADPEAELKAQYAASSWAPEEDEPAPTFEAAPLPSQPAETIVQPVDESVLQPVEAFELVREGDEELTAPTIVDSSASILQDPAADAPLTVQPGKVQELAANPIEWMATVPPLQVEEKSETTPESSEVTPMNLNELSPAEETIVEKVMERVAVPPPPAQVPPAPVLEPISVTPVKEELPPPPKPLAPPLALPPIPAAQILDPAKAQPPVKPIDQKPEDTARSIPKHDWTDMTASILPKPVAPAAEAPASFALPTHVPVPTSPEAPETTAKTQPATESAPAPGPTDPAVVDAVVQKILDKMKPQVVDIVTKEFLRPIVQALVHREIEKK